MRMTPENARRERRRRILVMVAVVQELGLVYGEKEAIRTLVKKSAERLGFKEPAVANFYYKKLKPPDYRAIWGTSYTGNGFISRPRPVCVSNPPAASAANTVRRPVLRGRRPVVITDETERRREKLPDIGIDLSDLLPATMRARLKEVRDGTVPPTPDRSKLVRCPDDEGGAS